MNKHFLQLSAIIISSIVFFSSCKDEPINPINEEDYSNGLFIVCEGNFDSNDGTISYINDSIIESNVFDSINERPLGDVVQSMNVIDNNAYIVVNNSQKVEVVTLETFKSIGTIKGLSFPRNVIKLNDNSILVSNGNGYENNYVYVVNSTTFEKTDSIATGSGPDKMIISNNKIYVANAGGFTNDSTITVINATTLAVEKTITVGDLPVDMKLDTDGNIIVLCKGATNWTSYEKISNSKIVKLKTSDNSVSTIVSFDHQISTYGSNVLGYYQGTIYYLDGGLYSITNDTSTPEKVISGSDMYGLSINPTNGNLWITQTPFGGNHTATQYSKTGTKIKEYETASYPNAVIF